LGSDLGPNRPSKSRLRAPGTAFFDVPSQHSLTCDRLEHLKASPLALLPSTPTALYATCLMIAKPVLSIDSASSRSISRCRSKTRVCSCVYTLSSRASAALPYLLVEDLPNRRYRFSGLLRPTAIEGRACRPCWVWGVIVW
jgi:hypothetical protein